MTAPMVASSHWTGQPIPCQTRNVCGADKRCTKRAFPECCTKRVLEGNQVIWSVSRSEPSAPSETGQALCLERQPIQPEFYAGFFSG